VHEGTAYIDLLSLSDRELLVYGTRLARVTPLENELLQRLEQRLEGDSDADDARR
jgi:hypothetical protein